MAVSTGIGVFGFLFIAVIWGLGALVLYPIIRFGVKHGMRSYYADAAGRPGPAAGPAGEPAP